MLAKWNDGPLLDVIDWYIRPMKRIVACLVSLSVVGVFIGSEAQAKVRAAASTASVYKIEAVSSDGVPPGCVQGCPTVTKTTPALTENTTNPLLANASKIQNISVPTNGGACALVGSSLYCWGSNSGARVGNGDTATVTTPYKAADDVVDFYTSQNVTCAVRTNGNLQCVGNTVFGPNPNQAGQPYVTFATATVLLTGVTRIEGAQNGNSAVCALRTDATMTCGYLTQLGGTFYWGDPGFTGVTSMKVMWLNGVTVCATASGVVRCRSMPQTSNVISFGTTSTIEDIGNAEAIYAAGSVICVYASGSLSCGNMSYSPTATALPSSLKTVGVMAKPLGLVYQSLSTYPYLFILLPTGILYAESWIWSCTSGCYNSGATITPVGAFTAAINNPTVKTYYSLASVNGVTDSMDTVPATVTSGTRILRSRPIVNISAGGVPVVGGTVTWASPDNPGQFKSSASAVLLTDADGNPKLPQLPSGPVTFTVKGGTVNGSYLQAAVVTVLVPDTGNVAVAVPPPASLVDRTVTVLNEDGTPVPSAVVTVKNNYLLYNYSNAGGSTATWSAMPPLTNMLNQVVCAMCFTSAPSLITGADGSVTFKSYAPSLRSSKYDIQATFDDGSISQTQYANLDSTSASVRLPFLAYLSTPYLATTKTDASGFVQFPVSLIDQLGADLSNLKVTVEEICNTLISGGLWDATKQFTTQSCGSGNVVGASVPGVEVSAAAASKCKSRSSMTNTSGKATVGLCLKKSTFVRVRTSGVVPSRAVCVMVKNKPCARPVRATPVTAIKAKKSITFAQVAGAWSTSRISIYVRNESRKICKVVGKKLVAIKAGVCNVGYNDFTDKRNMYSSELAITVY